MTHEIFYYQSHRITDSLYCQILASFWPQTNHKLIHGFSCKGRNPVGSINKTNEFPDHWFADIWRSRYFVTRQACFPRVSVPDTWLCKHVDFRRLPGNWLQRALAASAGDDDMTLIHTSKTFNFEDNILKRDVDCSKHLPQTLGRLRHEFEELSADAPQVIFSRSLHYWLIHGCDYVKRLA